MSITIIASDGRKSYCYKYIIRAAWPRLSELATETSQNEFTVEEDGPVVERMVQWMSKTAWPEVTAEIDIEGELRVTTNVSEAAKKYGMHNLLKEALRRTDQLIDRIQTAKACLWMLRSLLMDEIHGLTPRKLAARAQKLVEEEKTQLAAATQAGTSCDDCNTHVANVRCADCSARHAAEQLLQQREKAKTENSKSESTGEASRAPSHSHGSQSSAQAGLQVGVDATPDAENNQIDYARLQSIYGGFEACSPEDDVETGAGGALQSTNKDSAVDGDSPSHEALPMPNNSHGLDQTVDKPLLLGDDHSLYAPRCSGRKRTRAQSQQDPEYGDAASPSPELDDEDTSEPPHRNRPKRTKSKPKYDGDDTIWLSPKTEPTLGFGRKKKTSRTIVDKK